jgi:CheY-like chemotaxis protein
MDGREFLSEIKKDDNLKDLPVIIFSTLSHIATLEYSKSLGAFDYITKPGSFQELVNILKRYT